MTLFPILYYHHVGVRREPLGHRRLWISSAAFAEQMEYLGRAGYRGVSLRDAVPIILGEQRERHKTVALSFDDGYDNFYQHALPILLRCGFTATVFVVTREVGGSSRWDGGFETPLMDWRQIQEIHRYGIEIGSHTVSHPRLTRLAVDQAKRELLHSRLELEDKLGVAAPSVAYPYGDHNSLVQGLAAEAGYQLACSILRGNLHSSRQRFRLKRVPVDEYTSLKRFRRRLSPLYDLTCRLQRFSRTVRESTNGRENG